ncbi:MAG TPA: alkaline phosphatase family protein [bacterium]|nr:alkaline phosphatase family protein [bacterium]
MVLPVLAAAPIAAFPQAPKNVTTKTPVKHVIVIIGENRTFDSVYATYKPRPGQSVFNLLSNAVITDSGTPGENFSLSAQYTTTITGKYIISPPNKELYKTLPPPMTSYAPTNASDTPGPNGPPPPGPFATLAAAQTAETDLFATYYPFLLTGATGLPNNAVDTRIANVTNLPNGVFQLTGPSLKYDTYTGDMAHRFYQMWQQFDCNRKYISHQWPNGCLADLLPYVEVTIGAGNGGRLVPPGFVPQTGEGSNAMSFYNVQQGDAPYLKFLADRYTLSDNYHQPVWGGTMVQHLILGYADLPWYSDGNGHPMAPPITQVEDPNPQPGTNNYYTNDGGGAVYSNCSDTANPGVGPIVAYLKSLPRPIDPDCQKGRFYPLNNQSPQYNADGTLSANVKTVPPSTVRHIGDVLSGQSISWVYYGGHWDLAVANQPNAYCPICNPFQYAKDVMSDPNIRKAHIKDTTNLHQDIQNGTLPAVAYVKPDGLVDGHPASSKLDLFEGFVKKIITELQANLDLWKETTVFVTFDEGGGLYDVGYFEPLDYFGDGPRIPLIVVSPFTKGGRVSHLYGDHASIVKFIERNWGLPPITTRSRDNLPNPVTAIGNPYVPLNTPALSDLFGLFDFAHPDFSADN